jgi:hypothetical protein
VENKYFDRPVRVLIGSPGEIRIISSTREAAECLHYRWPVEGGRMHHSARGACMAAMEGLLEARVARKAFVLAAKEANILLPDDA